jgi:MarR family transcriptional regulator, organic hydroperoxide resistance regulator
MRDQFDKDDIVLENALAFWVNRFYETTRRAMYRAFREHGHELTPEQWMVLVRLWERDGRTQSELASVCHRDAPTMSRIVDSMSKGGLVARAVEDGDARTRLVVLTPKGREAKKTLVPVVRKLVAELERDIPERELEITRRTLRRIAERLD